MNRTVSTAIDESKVLLPHDDFTSHRRTEDLRGPAPQGRRELPLLEARPPGPDPEQGRRRELRGVVRGARRPDPGPAAAHAVDLAAGAMRIGDLADGARASASPPAPTTSRTAQEGRLRHRRQGRHLQHGLGQRRLLHRPAARRRRRHGHPVLAALLPRGPARRRDHPAGDRRRHAGRAGHLRRGPGHPQRHLRDQGPHRQAAAREVAARDGVGRRARRRRSSAGPQ